MNKGGNNEWEQNHAQKHRANESYFISHSLLIWRHAALFPKRTITVKDNPENIREPLYFLFYLFNIATDHYSRLCCFQFLQKQLKHKYRWRMKLFHCILI